jgi:hypothetical protein
MQECKQELCISDLSTLTELAVILRTAQGTIISIDLAGKTVAAGQGWIPGYPTPDLTVREGSKLSLSNGGLAMPPGCCLRVGPGGTMELNSVSITGQGAAGCGLVTVKGVEADARLKHCHITCQDRSLLPLFRTEGSSDAVLVADGGTGSLNDCTLTAAAGDGLSVRGTGSSAAATDCVISQCKGNAYAVSKGGRLSAMKCTADSNRGAGFLASGAGSTLQAGAACRASGNGAQGFNAEGTAKLICGQGCTAMGNAGSGFRSHALGSLLEAGPECRAEGSSKGSGFLAIDGGNLVAGDSCIATGNCYAGFHAWGAASQLVVGAACQSTGNEEQGFNVQGGAKLVAGDSCVAR